MNEKYFARQLSRSTRVNRVLEVLIAATVPSSGIAGLFKLFNSQLGEYTWEILTAIAAVAAFTKPFLKLADHIREQQQKLTEYRTLRVDAARLRDKIEQAQAYDAVHVEEFARLSNLQRDIALTDPGPEPKPESLRAIMQEVNRELPTSNFFIPGD